jgi:hypothetical protein
MVRVHVFLTCLLLGLLFATGPESLAQIKLDTAADPFLKLGDGQVVRYRVGTTVTASRGAIKDIYATMAVPFACPEQEAKVLEEDISPGVDSVKFRPLGDGVEQMLITMPYLAAGEEAHAIVTYEVHTHTILPPEENLTAQLVIPKKVDRDLKKYLGRSKFIQTNDSKIRRTLKDILATEKPEANDEAKSASADGESATTEDTTDKPAESKDTAEEDTAEPPAPPQPLNDWQRVEKIYDFVLDTVNYVEGDDKSALQTLREKEGDCHDVSALFIALCRAMKVPARMVWVEQHQYAEFCLEDAEGKLHWFPVESAGTRAFGAMPTARVILQKGDNFRDPDRPGVPLRYASEYMTATPEPGSGRPQQKFIRQQL